ncbi:MAG: hypothetical protein Crog4KO_25650 [Crocinitomicaceae bacterium]
MKIAKYTLIACLVATGFSATAQDDEKPQVRKEKKAKAMESLDLSDDQRAEIDALRTETREKLQAIKADEDMEQDAKKAEAKAIRKESREAMSAVLSDDQKAKLKEIKAERKAAYKDVTPEDVAKKQTEKMKEVVELTSEQEEKVYALNLKVANKIDVIKKDATMTDEQKKEFIKGNKEDKRRALEDILTADQLEAWDAHIASKKKMRTNMKKQEPANK